MSEEIEGTQSEEPAGDGSDGETLVDPADPASEENEVEPDEGEDA